MASYRWANIVGGQTHQGSAGAGVQDAHTIKVNGVLVYSTGNEQKWSMFLGELLLRRAEDESIRVLRKLVEELQHDYRMMRDFLAQCADISEGGRHWIRIRTGESKSLPFMVELGPQIDG